MDFLKDSLITKLKFIFDDKDMDIMDKFNKLSVAYKKSKLLDASSLGEDAESTDADADDTIMVELQTHKENQLRKTFKKIQLLFSVLGDLMKFLVMQIADEKYAKAVSEKIVFPKSVDKLAIVIGCYNDAFTHWHSESMYNIITIDCFADLCNIAGIHQDMIPFVANDKLNMDELSRDYDIFSEKTRHFACDVLDINLDFNNNSMMYMSDDELDNDDINNLVMEEML